MKPIDSEVEEIAKATGSAVALVEALCETVESKEEAVSILLSEEGPDKSVISNAFDLVSYDDTNRPQIFWGEIGSYSFDELPEEIQKTVAYNSRWDFVPGGLCPDEEEDIFCGMTFEYVAQRLRELGFRYSRRGNNV